MNEKLKSCQDCTLAACILDSTKATAINDDYLSGAINLSQARQRISRASLDANNAGCPNTEIIRFRGSVKNLPNRLGDIGLFVSAPFDPARAHLIESAIVTKDYDSKQKAKNIRRGFST
jgi:hypothetical protein